MFAIHAGSFTSARMNAASRSSNQRSVSRSISSTRIAVGNMRKAYRLPVRFAHAEDEGTFGGDQGAARGPHERLRRAQARPPRAQDHLRRSRPAAWALGVRAEEDLRARGLHALTSRSDRRRG